MIELGNGFSFDVRTTIPKESALAGSMLSMVAWAEARKRLDAVGISVLAQTGFVIYPVVEIEGVEKGNEEALPGWVDCRAVAHVKLYRMV